MHDRPTDAQHTEFVISGAESLLRVRPVSLSAQRTDLSIIAGEWLRDPAAGYVRSAMGVPLDDVTGYVIAAGRTEGWWPVSLGIRVDFVADPPSDGSTLSVTGELVARDMRGGTTRGSVVDLSGTAVALVTQRSHFVPVQDAPTGDPRVIAPPDESVTVREALGISEVSQGIISMAPTEYAANGMHNLHGGVLIIGAEFAAMSAVEADRDFRTTSIDIAYVRPGDAADTTTFRADVVHRGRSLAVVRVSAANSSGKPCALATVVVQKVCE